MNFLAALSFSIPCQDSTAIGDCISGIYSWSLLVVGVVAFVEIIYAGWMYLTAAGNTNKTGDAMKKISNAVLGIVLLFSSYLILNTINPDLVGGGLSLPNLKGDKIENVNYNSPNTPANNNASIVKGKVTDSGGKPLANVLIYDNNRVSYQGALKIGKTNTNGDIVFDQQFVSFLKSVFPSNEIAAGGDNTTVTLPQTASSIPDGLTVRYELGSRKLTKTPAFTTSSGQKILDLSATLP